MSSRTCFCETSLLPTTLQNNYKMHFYNPGYTCCDCWLLFYTFHLNLKQFKRQPFKWLSFFLFKKIFATKRLQKQTWGSSIQFLCCSNLGGTSRELQRCRNTEFLKIKTKNSPFEKIYYFMNNISNFLTKLPPNSTRTFHAALINYKPRNPECIIPSINIS